MDRLEKNLGYTFKNKELLLTALTHSSYANERNGDKLSSYERLEFLGDSILGLITAKFLYIHEPQLPEGKMTSFRAELVCESSLHKVALELDLGRYMRLGKGEEKSGGRTRPSILADMVEAIIAAICLDSSIEMAERFALAKVLKDADLDAGHRSSDYKTALQEFVQRKSNQRIEYKMLSEEGPDHNKTFGFGVFINGELAGKGLGHTKKEAEQNAACEALEELRKWAQESI